MVRHNTAVVTFMELNMIMRASYLVLLLCYDNHILGDRHPVTLRNASDSRSFPGSVNRCCNYFKPEKEFMTK